MIAFATLFLGLVTGVVPVTVLVQGPAAEVRLEVDGAAAGSMKAPPWTIPVDFGSVLAPHELLARAFDSDGREIGVTRQMVNLPRPPAEVEVMLERDAQGNPVAARYSGSSLVALRPVRATVTFDQTSLKADEKGRVELPAYESREPHVLSVELEFSSAVKSRADVVFGGGTTSMARSELTAVPVRVKSASATLSPKPDLLVEGGRSLSVAAVEEGPVFVCVVRGPTVSLALSVLGTGGRTTLQKNPGSTPLPEYNRDASRGEMTLGKGDRLRFLWPVTSVKDAAPGTQLFDHSRDFDVSPAGAGIHWLLTRVEHPGPYPGSERLADAAAVAGLEAAASGGRRAVVLILGDEAVDPSRHTPVDVRQYLATVRVPLFVWSLKGLSTQPLASQWPGVEDVSSTKGLSRAVEHLKAELARQRIVWVEGRYLPQQIDVSPKAPGVELAK